MSAEAAAIVKRLGLAPHPEGGFYREIHRARVRVRHPGVPDGEDPGRAAATAIYYLLAGDDFSAFHRVRSDETWHHYAGGDLELHLLREDGEVEERLLTGDLARGEPVTTVEAGVWQAARLAAGAAWVLVGCTVAPGFDFADFELADRDVLRTRFPSQAERIRTLTRP